MEFGPSQSPAPTPPRPLHRWANEGAGVGPWPTQLYRWPNPVGAWPLCTPNLDGGQGPGAKHPLCSWAAPAFQPIGATVQLGMVRAGYPMVGRSFGRALAGACTVRRSLYHTHWVCAVCCAQWAVPTDQLAQFGTKRAKRGPGVRGLWPQLWAPTISPVLGGSITSPPVGGSITS